MKLSCIKTETNIHFLQFTNKIVLSTFLVQNNCSNKQWYELFNTKIDVGSAIGVTRQHQVLLSQIVEESNNKFEEMTPEEKKETREDVEEHYQSYIFLSQSGKQHHKLKTNPQNDFTAGNDM